MTEQKQIPNEPAMNFNFETINIGRAELRKLESQENNQ